MDFFERKEIEYKNAMNAKNAFYENKDKIDIIYIEFMLPIWAMYEEYRQKANKNGLMVIANPTSEFKFEDIYVYSINNKRVYLNAPGIGYYVPYDFLEEYCNRINGGTEIAVEFTIEKEIDGFTFILSDYLVSNLPEEDILLLENLGKINVEEVKPKINKSIFCQT